MVFVNLSIDPFMDTEQNVLSLFCLVQLATTLFMGLMLKIETLDPTSETSAAMFNLLIFLQVRAYSYQPACVIQDTL